MAGTISFASRSNDSAHPTLPFTIRHPEALTGISQMKAVSHAEQSIEPGATRLAATLA